MDKHILDKFIIIEIVYGLEYVVAMGMCRSKSKVPVYGILANPYFLKTMKVCANKHTSREEAEKAIAELYEDMIKE